MNLTGFYTFLQIYNCGRIIHFRSYSLYKSYKYEDKKKIERLSEQPNM